MGFFLIDIAVALALLVGYLVFVVVERRRALTVRLGRRTRSRE